MRFGCVSILLATLVLGSAAFVGPLMGATRPHTSSSPPSCLGMTHNNNKDNNNNNNKDMMMEQDSGGVDSNRRSILSLPAWTASTTAAASLLLLSLSIASSPAQARLEAVNRPDLLPKESGRNVIQTEKFLTSGQANRMNDLLTALERDTGFRVRVLCQAYPNTPGLAIRDYWDLGKEDQKDDKYVVLVVDQFGGRGNVLNFNVGDGVKFALPNVFWTRLSAKYGTTFYVRDNGIDLAVINAIEAIVSCLRSEESYCVNVPDQGQSLRTLGLS